MTQNLNATRAEENADLVRSGYNAFNTADVEALLQIVDESATWHTPGRGILAGDAVGRDAVLAHFGRYGSDTNGTFRAELLDVTANDHRAIAMHRNTGERNGKRLAVDCCIVFDIRDRRVVSGTEYFYDLDAWDAFWS